VCTNHRSPLPPRLFGPLQALPSRLRICPTYVSRCVCVCVCDLFDPLWCVSLPSSFVLLQWVSCKRTERTGCGVRQRRL
jgi:hypothetical protein